MRSALLAMAWLLAAGGAAAQATVYRCPGNPESYTNLLTPQEARDKGCRSIEGAPVTVVSAPRTRPAASGASGPRSGEGRVDPADQKARDQDAKRILTEELRREEERLQQLQSEYKGGEPDRRGDERNYQRYQDRVAEMKAAIQRKEADIAALRRELAKFAP